MQWADPALRSNIGLFPPSLGTSVLADEKRHAVKGLLDVCGWLVMARVRRKVPLGVFDFAVRREARDEHGA